MAVFNLFKINETKNEIFKLTFDPLKKFRLLPTMKNLF